MHSIPKLNEFNAKTRAILADTAVKEAGTELAARNIAILVFALLLFGLFSLLFK